MQIMDVVVNGLRRHGHSRRGRGGFGEIGGSWREVSVPRITLLAGNSAGTLVGLAVAVARLENAVVGLAVRFRRLRPRSPPAGKVPIHAREALQLQRFSLPLATRGSRPI